MATERNLIFANDQIYHIYNRGMNRQPVFTKPKEFERILELIRYYRFADMPLRYSKFKVLPEENRNAELEAAEGLDQKHVDLITYSFLPNRFNFLLKQERDEGVRTFVSNITNSYTKYFNARNDREGPLFAGTFKAVRIETDTQLLEMSRYLHLAPVLSYVTTLERLVDYPWTSYGEYISSMTKGICTGKHHVLKEFASSKQYEGYVTDQEGFEKNVEKIQHLGVDI